MKTYAPRTTLRFDVAFTRASDGSAADPTTVIFHVQYEKETPVDYVWPTSPTVVVRDGLGLFHIEFTPDKEGLWRYAWQGTGDVQASTLDTIFRVMSTDLIS